MANENGTTNIANKRRVIPVTASHRRPCIQPWSLSRNGQVATTIIVAHTIAVRNGKRIQIRGGDQREQEHDRERVAGKVKLPFCHSCSLRARLPLSR